MVAAGLPPRDIVLVNRVASTADILYADVLVSSRVRVILVAPDVFAPGSAQLPAGWMLADRFDAPTLSSLLPATSIARRAYLVGSPAFVARTRKTLGALHIRHIRTDAFTGY